MVRLFFAYFLVVNARIKDMAANGNGTQNISYNSLRWEESFPTKYMIAAASRASNPTTRKIIRFIAFSFGVIIGKVL